MKKLTALGLGVLLLCSPASGSPVSWGSYRMLFSSERESATGYSLVARGVSGRLGVTRDVTYSLGFQGGRVEIGRRVLRAGCFSGRLGKGSVLVFRGVGRMEFHIPSRGCPRR